MGYLTYYTLDIVSGSDEDFDALVGDIRERTGIDFSRDNSAEAKWYDCEKDMTALSKKYPDLVVQLDGDGEDSDDLWSERFRSGECESVGVEMPDFIRITTETERRRLLKRIIPGAKRRLILLIDAILADMKDASVEPDLVLRESEVTETRAVKVTRNGDGIDVWLSQHYRGGSCPEGKPVDRESLSVDELYAIAAALLG